MLNSCHNNVLVTDIICLIFNPVFSETVKLDVILKVHNKTSFHSNNIFYLLYFLYSEQAEAQRLKSRQARQRKQERKAQKKAELLAFLAKEDEQKK